MSVQYLYLAAKHFSHLRLGVYLRGRGSNLEVDGWTGNCQSSPGMFAKAELHQIEARSQERNPGPSHG